MTTSTDYPPELDAYTAVLTSFGTFRALLNAYTGYRPTMRMTGPMATELADAYDRHMSERGDVRRVFRLRVTPNSAIAASKKVSL